MCGRYTLNKTARQLGDVFRASFSSNLPERFCRFNVAPSQPIAVVRAGHTDREIAMVRWGLVPHWANDPKIGNRMVNARAEKVLTSGAFKHAMRYRRCLIPADGFYEWKASATGKGTKQPYYFQREDGETFAMAGLWEHWQDEHGNELETATVITTEPNALVAEVHDRMPVIVSRDEYDAWLDTPSEQADSLTGMLNAYPPGELTAWPVGREVNKPAHEGPELIEPIDEEPRTHLFPM